MRARLLAPVALVALAATAPAQTPPPDVAAPPAVGGMPWTEPARCPEGPSRVNWDLLVGLPTGLRGQVRVTDDPATAWLVEGFVGAEFVLPTVGVGVRRRITCWDDGCQSFCVNPGVGVYGVYALLGGAVVAVGDVDLVWTRRLARGGSVDLGLKIGAGPAFADILWLGRGEGVLPAASVIAAWRF